MSVSEDDEILQDFLVEAGEILETLSEQLVDLEQSPDDAQLLNAIFRGFHTVKGGAGFLQLTPMVDCCHITENLFDILRTGRRRVTPELMDVVLQALDMVNRQFQQLSNGEEVGFADPALIAALTQLVDEDSPTASAVDAPAASSADDSGDIVDSEFEAMLDALDASGAEHMGTAEADDGDEITDEEFEALLDQLHGAGKGPGATVSGSKAAKPEASQSEVSQPEASQPEKEPLSVTESGDMPVAGDEITDDEFEALLDQLHGKGKGPGGPARLGATSQAADKPAAPPQVKSPASPAVKKPPPQKQEPDQKAPVVAAPLGDSPAPQEGKATADAGTAADATVRVDTQRLDDIMNMVGELVLVRNRLVRLGADTEDESLAKAVANLDVVTADLQTAVMQTRMQPIRKVFGRFPRVVRDLARNLKKEVKLELVGEDTDLDKNLVEALADPLVHLVRNSVDHGIEEPEVRLAAGKPKAGKIVLAAQQEGDHILLSITDDGAGMDPDKLRRIAVQKGLFDMETANRLSDSEAFNLIFAPGFSTKSEISDVSGRGVGMDVVKTKITQLNGSVEIESTLGEGTRLNIRVPLTLAIMPTLMIMLGDRTFALPLATVNEIFYMDLAQSHVVDGQKCVLIRDQAVPLFFLKKWLLPRGTPVVESGESHVVIVSVGLHRVGFAVDQLVGQEEVVIKPLGKMLQGTPGMAGATITGDGGIALILDVPGLLKHYAAGSRTTARSYG